MPKKHKQSLNAPVKWYEINAKGKDEAEVLIYGNIGPSFWDDESVTAKGLIEELKDVEGKDLTVRINSVGGSVADGIAIFNALRRHDGSVTVEVDAVAYSAASLIAMAGDTVIMADNGMLMVHAPMTFASGNSKALRRQADVLDKYADAMNSAYVRSGGPSKDVIDGWLKDGEDHYFTAQEALDLGMIDDTTESVDIAACADGIDFGKFKSLESIASPPTAALPAANLSTGKQEGIMPKKTETTPAGNEPTDINITEIEAAAIKKRDAEITARNNEVIAVLSPHMHVKGMTELKDKVMADPSITVDMVRQQALEMVGQGYESINQPGAICIEDEQDKRIEGVTNIILARSHIKKEDGKSVQTQGNPWRGMTLLDMCRDSLARAGIDARGMSKMEVVAAGFTQSTSDFSVLLENAMHKALLSGYALTIDTWSRFCATGSVSDFRAHNRYMVGSLGNLEDLTELGEFENKQIPDGRKQSVSIDTKGNLINISRQAIINDDLGAFVGLANALGRSARRTIEAKVYETLALNSGMGPTLSDSVTLFHADHSNVGTGAAISVASIDADRVLMASQTDVSGNDYLDLRPSILLLPIGLGGAARELNAQEYNDEATKQQKRPNSVRGLYNDIVDTPRISGTIRYSFADPNEAPVLEVSFLDGEQAPFLDTKDGWEVDGAQYKARLDFGVSGVGFEGAVVNAGA